ncbi:MAG TPA: carbohydrate-binding protein [Myxococcales bacterium]|jgi:hypothetical protein
MNRAFSMLALFTGIAFPALAQTAHYGTPLSIPNTFEAEDFDNGGEGLAYHDNVPGNAGGAYRPAEDVDIIVSPEPNQAGGYVVNNFETGEWMLYTVNVSSTRAYDISIRASNNYSASSAFHVEVDGHDVTGSVVVPMTGSWDVFQWVGKQGVTLSAGQHQLKLVCDRQYFNVNQIDVEASASTSPAFGGTPANLPGTIEAENFDTGGEGSGYHDLVAGNAGGQYRPFEDVDIVAGGTGYVVNNFQNGEWMAYTVNVTASGNYDVGIVASNNYAAGSTFHIAVDGTDVTGPVQVPLTGSWDTFQLAQHTGVPLTAGQHRLVLFSDVQYFNVDRLSVVASAQGPTGNPAFACDFEGTYCGFTEQYAGDQNSPPAPVRSSFVPSSRGGTAVRLHTEITDNNVHGSGDWVRDDLSLGVSPSYCNEGQEEWWAHSVLFPDDYVFPTGSGGGVLLDFHQNLDSGLPNFDLEAIPGVGLRLRGEAGALNTDTFRQDLVDPYGAPAGSITRNVWYDFVYHVRWTSGSTGIFEAWLNGHKVLTWSGPTLYSGVSCYLKLANYHSPETQASSLVHDRVRRGASAADVALGPLD